MSAKAGAYFKTVIAMILVGGFVALNKLASAALPIFLFSELRLGIAALILSLILLKKESKFPTLNKRDVLVLFIQAFLGVFLFSMFLLLGSKYTSAIESGIITSLTPALVAIVSVIIFKERLSSPQKAGIAMALAGAILINVFGISGNMSWTVYSLLGNILILMAVTGEAFFVTFGKLVSKQISPLAVSTIVITIGAVLNLPFAISQAIDFDFSTISWSDGALVFYSAVPVSVVAVLFINQAAKVLPGSSTAVFTAIMPVSAILVSFFVLGEQLLWYHMVGIACVVFSIMLVSMTSKQKTVKGREMG
ncbi:DMT family transporter [Neobacillus sp. Marseille-QA0830]